jgi:hypothetical protein
MELRTDFLCEIQRLINDAVLPLIPNDLNGGHPLVVLRQYIHQFLLNVNLPQLINLSEEEQHPEEGQHPEEQHPEVEQHPGDSSPEVSRNFYFIFHLITIFNH